MPISEEENKAIENIKHVKEELNKDKEEMIDYGAYQLFEMFSNDLDIILKLIEKRNKELEEKETLYQKALNNLVISDKMIDVMADCIAYGGKIHEGKPEKVKEYFRKKAEES